MPFRLCALAAGIACLAALLAGCGSGKADTLFRIPAEYVSDTVVVPPELAAEYAATANIDFDHPVYDPTKASMVPLSLRRAVIYRNFTGITPISADLESIFLRTAPAEDGAYSDTMAALAAQAGLSIIHEWHRDADYHRHPLTTHFNLQTQKALSVGELAWVADWLLRQKPDIIMIVDPVILGSAP